MHPPAGNRVGLLGGQSWSRGRLKQQKKPAMVVGEMPIYDIPA